MSSTQVGEQMSGKVDFSLTAYEHVYVQGDFSVKVDILQRVEFVPSQIVWQVELGILRGELHLQFPTSADPFWRTWNDNSFLPNQEVGMTIPAAGQSVGEMKALLIERLEEIEHAVHAQIDERHRKDRRRDEELAAGSGKKLLPDTRSTFVKAFRSNGRTIEKIEQFSVLDEYRPVVE